jgi:hypothetical protein
MVAATTPARSRSVMSLSVSPAWKQFVEQLAQQERCSRADLIDKAVAEFSRKSGVEPPKR